MEPFLAPHEPVDLLRIDNLSIFDCLFRILNVILNIEPGRDPNILDIQRHPQNYFNW